MSKFSLGDIVALNSHPYDQFLTSVVISGEPQLLSPLMVVTEILNDTRNQYDEKTGDEISKTGNAQCKCIWYSNKSHQFEETWVSSKMLCHIEHNVTNQYNLTDLDRKTLYDKLVVLKTSNTEAKSKKALLA